MPEYIKLEPLRNEILNDTDPAYDSDTINHFLGIVDSQPTADVVEVVRCKDCEMSRETEDERYLFCMQFADTVGFRAFCSYGVRKEGAEE